jgi:hypothetical protein
VKLCVHCCHTHIVATMILRMVGNGASVPLLIFLHAAHSNLPSGYIYSTIPYFTWLTKKLVKLLDPRLPPRHRELAG